MVKAQATLSGPSILLSTMEGKRHSVFFAFALHGGPLAGALCSWRWIVAAS